MEEARPARFADLQALAQLRREALAELAALRGGDLYQRREAPPEPLEDDLAAALAGERRSAWVGTLDGQTVGYGLARCEVLPGGGSPHGVVEALYVTPGGREVGVGEALLNAMVDWLVARGCDGIDAMALPGHRVAKNFLESAGFKARLLILHRSVGPSSDPGVGA